MPGVCGGDDAGIEPGCLHQLLVVADEPGEPLGAECREQVDSSRLALGLPRCTERLEAGALPFAPLRAVGREVRDEDIEVPDGAEPGPDRTELVPVASPCLRLEPVAEDPPRGAHPTRRDPHRVDLLDVLPGDDARHARERPGEVEAEDLAPGLRPRVGGAQIGRPASRETLRRDGGSPAREVLLAEGFRDHGQAGADWDLVCP